MCFLPYKVFVKLNQDYILVNELDVSLMTRNNVIKFQLLAYHQFASVKFIPNVQVWVCQSCTVKSESYFTY